MLNLGARCALLLPDGSLGGESVLATVGAPIQQLGGGLQTVNFDDHCNQGQAVAFVFGSQGQAPILVEAIRSLGIGCAPVREWVATGTRGQQFLPHGNTTGTAFSDQCSTGYAVTSFTVGSGSVSIRIIERLQTTCTRIRP